MRIALDKFIENINKCHILGMGEATHGGNKINKFILSTYKKMIKFGFSSFILEADYFLCRDIDDCIKEKNNYKLKNLAKTLGWIWNTRNMYKLLKYMKTYNKKHNNHLSIIGVDLKTIIFDDEVEHLLKKHYNNKIDMYAIKLCKKLYKYKNNDIQSSNMRDLCMYKLFNKLYVKNNKYFIYAHHGHLQKKSDDEYVRFGTLLANKYQHYYVAVGNSFYSGQIKGHEMNLNKISTVKIQNKKILKDGIYDNANVIILNNGYGIYENSPHKLLWKSTNNGKFDFVVIIDNEIPKK